MTERSAGHGIRSKMITAQVAEKVRVTLGNGVLGWTLKD